MRISDWSSDVCSSDLMASSFVASLLALGPREALSSICSPARFRPADPRSTRSGDGSIVAIGPAHVSHAPPRRAALRGDRDHGGRRRGNGRALRSEEHTSELQSLMRISYAVFCLKKKKTKPTPI